ncbi:MAG: hypothetical protein JWM43_2179 [Acidobacteriaceae bacterium]|nr:hypothetical protein [Acidobacteriaceae bacterium]
MGEDLPELGVGMVYFAGLEPLLEAHPGVVDLLEIEPQTTWLERPDLPGEILIQPEVEAHLAQLPYRKLVHSVGTPVGGSVPGIEMQLPLLRDCVKRWNAPWASEHLAFNLTPDFFTGFFLPPRQTDAGIDVYVPAIRRLADAVKVPFAFETGVNYLRPRADEIPDGEFIAEVAQQAECGILLDLHNIYANEWNGRQKVQDFLQQIPLDRVWEMHVAGGFELDGYWLDAHSGAMPDAMVALAREIIPHLPNLKAIVFEVFTSFLPRFGLDAVRDEMEKVRSLWELRRPAMPHPAATTAMQRDRQPERESQVAVAEWESALGGLAIGQQPEGAVAIELASDKGVELMRGLIHEFRASMVVGVYRLSCRMMMLVLTPDVFRAILEDFWQHHPPHQYAAAEADSFMNYLRGKNIHWPQLAKVIEFEKAAMEVVLNGEPRVVKFAADPFPLLRALAEGRLPDGVPQVGDFEIELKPDGPITVTGIDMEQIRGAFPFH